MSDDTSTVTAPPPPPPPVTSTGPAPGGHPGGPRRGGGYVAGIVLIVIGVLFLIGRLSPGFGFWNLWPLIIIVAGLIQALTPGKEGWSIARLFDGLSTVAIGGVFLAITFGVVGWGVWGTILSLWPVLVISIGLDILGKSLHTSVFKVIGSLLVIAALAYAVSVNVSGAGRITWYVPGDAERAEISEPARGIDEASLLVKSGVADVTLDGGRELVEAEGSSPFGTPEFTVERGSQRSADVNLSLGEGGVTWWPGGPTGRLEASIARDVLWDIELEVGLADVRADLSDVDVRTLVVRPGITACEVRLGEPVVDQGFVDVRAGFSSVRISVPEDAEVRVESESGLLGTDIPGEFEETGNGEWETPGFRDARDADDPVWVVRVRSGIGSFTLDTY